MPFPTALQTGDYTNLRTGGHKASEYLLLSQNVTVFAARVNQSTFTTSFAQITYDNVTTGAYTDLLEGMTVLISSSNDKRAAYFVGRIRKGQAGAVANSTLINVNETSATISDNDYIFVLNDYRLFHELGRFVGGVYYKDYNLTFAALKPIIYGLQSAYAGVVSGSPAGFTVAFAASAVAATSGATISSYAWTIPSGGTVTAGATNTANVTVRFDASANEYWVKLVVTDSGSRTQVRYIPVFAVPADLSTTVYLGANGASIDGDIDNGYSASVDVFAGFSSVLDNTLAVILDVEYYGTTQTSIYSAVKFVGRIRTDRNQSQANETISVSQKASVNIEDVAQQMARITTPLVTARDKASAAAWDEITKLTVWRAVTYLLEHSTFHTLHSLSFDSTADTFYAYQLAAQQGNLLSGANDFLKSINAALEFSPTGEVRAVRNAVFQSTAQRNALTTVADFEAQDWINFSLNHEHVQTIGLVEASGATYGRAGGIAAANVTPYLSVAPGVAQGNAEGTSPLPGQILQANQSAANAKSELNTRAGNQFAFANGAEELTVDFRTGYNWITPSRYQWYTFTIAASDDTFGRAYTTADRWLCKSVSVRHDNITGKKDTQGIFALETSGDDAGATGQNVPIPAPTTTPPILPTIPPVPAYPYFPPPPDVYLPPDPTPDQIPPYTPPSVPVDGNAVVYMSASHVWMTRTFFGLNTSYDITPPNALSIIEDIALVGQRIYVLSSDGTNSMMHSAPNAFTPTPVYTDSASMSGVYTAIRPTSTEGALYIKKDGDGSSVATDGWSVEEGLEVSRTDTTITATSLIVFGEARVILAIDGYRFSGIPPTDLSRYVSISTAGSINRTGWFLPGYDIGVPANEQTAFGGFSPTCITWIDVVFNGGGGDSITFTLSDSGGCGVIGNTTATRYSTDYGATFATPVTVSTLGGGLDTIKIGVPILVGASGQVRIATSAGGAYSDYGSATPSGVEPSALVIPRYVFGSTSSGNTTSTPEYLIGSNVLGASNKAILKATSSGGSFADVTPVRSGSYGLVISQDSLSISWWSGSKFAAVLDFGGSPFLFTSTSAGASWSDRGILDGSARQVTHRRGDRTALQLYLTNGGPAYSLNGGSSIVTKSYPSDPATEPVLKVLPYG